MDVPAPEDWKGGYKTPPFERRFKKGQKPPPRKKKPAPDISNKEIFWRVLQERRRVEIEGKVLWLTNAELIARRAFLEADKGSAVLGRLLNQLLLGAGDPEDGQPEIILGSP
jgi:hypothetical protein